MRTELRLLRPRGARRHCVVSLTNRYSLSILLIGATIVLGTLGGRGVAFATRSPVVTVASLTPYPLSVRPVTKSSPAEPRNKLPAYTVTTRHVTGLGTILVDGKGQTLYVFLQDHRSGHSTCNSECAVQWPPLLLPAGITKPLASSGAKSSLLATTRRIDGAVQVTYKGWPLYRFALDTAPGVTAGEGLDNLGGLWYVMNPKGTVIH
jgi:predicted lipoprotein with Yx(FWY)xxD motif